MVLRSFRQAIYIGATIHVGIHSRQAGGDGDLFIAQTGWHEGVLVDPFVSGQDPLVVIAFQITIGSRVLSHEIQGNRRLIVQQIACTSSVNLAMIAPNQQARRTNPGAILVAGEIKYTQLVAEVQIRYLLLRLDHALLRWWA